MPLLVEKTSVADDFLIDLNRLFLGISSAINPYQQALTFANYLIRNGINLLPSDIMFFVRKFRTLPEAIQDYVIQNTVTMSAILYPPSHYVKLGRELWGRKEKFTLIKINLES